MARRRARGELESAVLRELWASDVPLSAKDLQSNFTQPIPALTTLLTVLDRLVGKGTVVRTAAPGRGSVFAASTSEASHAAGAMVTALLSSSDRSAALTRFAGHLGECEVEALRKALGPESFE